MGSFDLVHDTISRIQSNDAIPNCSRENRMKYGMDDFHTVRLKAFFMNQRQVKSLDVTILDIGQLHVSDFISDILIIHVLIVSSGRFLDLNLLGDIPIKVAVQSRSVRFMCMYSIFEISANPFLH